MPTILIEGPYRFFFVSIDLLEPPHIHIQRESMVAKFWLDPVVLEKAGGFKSKELNKIGKIVIKHQDSFLEQWYEFFGH